MEQKVIGVFQNKCEEEDVVVTRDSRILEDLAFSSMDFFSIIVDVEDECGVSISERELQQLETVGDVINLVESKNLQ